MKFLISSNGPHIGTGYGVQTGLLVDRLTRQGHTVAVACNYGQQAGSRVWRTPGGADVVLYPAGYTNTSDDILVAHAMHFFEGDPRSGWIIILNDMWAIDPRVAAQLEEFNVAAWTPIDHMTCPPGVAGFLNTSHAVPIAMSRHGEHTMTRLGFDPTYIPLAVDTTVFKPTFRLATAGGVHDARTFHRIPPEAFVVGMVAMNKGWVLDRKGFSEALFAFSIFHAKHPNSMIYLHTEEVGADGMHLKALAATAGIPDEAIIWSNPYAYRHGFSGEMMASLYTSFDVLLAPSHGEGFCVPMIEAQACGTPVVVSDATAQAELVGAGWTVDGQPVWDQSQRCPAFAPSITDIVDKLELAYTADLVELQTKAIEFAARYDADAVFDTYWVPFLNSLEPPQPVADKPVMGRVAVIVPAMRSQFVKPLVDSFEATNDGTADLYFVADPDNGELIETIEKAGYVPLITSRGHTFAQKANEGYAQTTEDWLFLCGEDVEFTDGWIGEARKLSDRFDLIGTNDSEAGRVRNRDVAAGRHADHWFTRRAYIDDEGSCLEGPGVFAPEAYYHWWVDKEIVGLARARGVYGHADECRVIHHHPGYDGDENARAADPVYMKAVEWADRDRITFLRRVPLIEGQRVSRGAA